MKKLLTILGALALLGAGEARADPETSFTVVAASTPEDAEIDRNTSNIAVLRFSIQASKNKDGTVTSIRLTSGGTAVVPTEIDQVKLYRDTDADGVFDYDTDEPLGTAQVFASGGNTVNFTGLSVYFAGANPATTIFFWAVVRSTENAVVGHYFNLRVAAASDISTSENNTVTLGTPPPTSADFTFYGLKVALGANTPPGDSAWTSALYKDMLQIQLNAYGENVNVTSVTLTAGGTATLGPSGDVKEFNLYLDANGNGRYDSGETKLGTTQTAASTVTFSGFSQSVTTSAAVNLIATSVSNTTVTAGRTFSLGVAANGDVSGTGASTSKSRPGQGTAQGNTMTFSQGNPVLNISLGQNSRP
ncbi:MAG TPA: hypothetical protein P5569_10370, partial [Candidatus Latescibacteria bacterium]|nr:hypothetical protein [Candidatus Latescibacterota bacterium]